MLKPLGAVTRISSNLCLILSPPSQKKTFSFDFHTLAAPRQKLCHNSHKPVSATSPLPRPLVFTIPCGKSGTSSVEFVLPAFSRRQALLVAGIEEPPGTYKHDLFDPELADSIPQSKAEYLRAFLMQVEKLSSINTGNEIPPFLRRHLIGTHVVASEQSLRECASVYGRYVDEWLRVIRTSRDQGLAWAEMLGRTATAA